MTDGPRRGGASLPVLAVVLTAILIAACGGSSGTPSTVTPEANTPTPDADAQATRVAASPASKLDAALLQAADLPDRLPRLGGNVQAIASGDVPGLTSDAVVNGARFLTATSDEFLNETAIVPDHVAAVQSMMDQFGADLYLQGLTGNATDAQSSPLAFATAPAGARGLHYSGTSIVGGATGHVEGEAIAFTHGRVFVLLVHTARNPALPPLDLGALASLIDARLSQIPEANE